MANIEKHIAEAILAPAGLGPRALGLRFDRVVVSVLGELRAFAETAAPQGACVIVTLSAPIRVPAQTAEALKGRIAAVLSAGASAADQSVTVHSNTVRIRIVAGRSSRMPKLIGFVHNPGSNPQTLLDLAEQWLCTQTSAQ